MRRHAFVFVRGAALALLVAPTLAVAGPPFLTDDPEPTDTGHWEIYAPLFESEGSGGDVSGTIGAEINYGPIKDVQLTVGLPVDFTHDQTGYRWGAGDLAASLKYRFYHDKAAGIQIAVFPGLTLPTASHGLGAGHVTALLPIWAQKDSGKWSIFGGGGYAINPGAGNRDYWTGGIALKRQISNRLLLGIEGDRQGPDTIAGRASTRLGLGAIYHLVGPLSLLASGGPTFTDDGGNGFHAFTAIGVNF